MALIDVNGKRFKNFMAKLYGFGAAIVILGAMFKIMHWTGADIMLVVGLSTEAVIFFFSAFEKPAADYDWTLVYPELVTGEEADERGESVVQQLDATLEDNGVDAALIQRLGEGMRNLSETASSLTGAVDAAGATAAYSEQLTTAASNMENLNALYAVQLENTTAAVDKQNSVMEKLSASSDNASELAEQLAAFKSNVTNLNTVYGGMLSAMSK